MSQVSLGVIVWRERGRERRDALQDICSWTVDLAVDVEQCSDHDTARLGWLDLPLAFPPSATSLAQYTSSTNYDQDEYKDNLLPRCTSVEDTVR